MPVYAGMINSVYKTSWFIFYRNEVIFLFKKIQENIDARVNHGRDMKRYVEVDRTADGFVKNFAYSMVGAIFFMVFGPATIICFHYFKGTLTDDVLKLPIDSM